MTNPTHLSNDELLRLSREGLPNDPAVQEVNRELRLRGFHLDPKTGAGLTTGPREERQPVVVRDFNMPFGSMIGFMVKWSIASIPAVIIITVMFYLVVMVLRELWAG